MNQEQEETISLSKAEWEELQALRAEREERMASQKAQQDRLTWRGMSEEFVDTFFPRLQECSRMMAEVKKELFTSAGELLEMKSSIFNHSESQKSHNFTNARGDRRIRIGYNQKDDWDAMAENGVEMVKEYITNLASDEKTKKMVNIILDLLSKDRQGNLQADKVLQLERYAMESENKTFIEGVAIIRESYRPAKSKFFIRIDQKNEQGKWVSIPLLMTDV